MKLISLNIDRGWSEGSPLRGRVKFRHTEDQTELEIRLDDEDMEPVVRHCASAIVKAVERSNANMIEEALRHGGNLIEHTDSSASV